MLREHSMAATLLQADFALHGLNLWTLNQLSQSIDEMIDTSKSEAGRRHFDVDNNPTQTSGVITQRVIMLVDTQASVA